MRPEEGFLVVGIGGGEFDEHTTLKRPGAQNDCAATLAAKKWGLRDKPELSQMFDYLLANDRDAQGGPFDLAAAVRAMHRLHKDDPLRTIHWTMEAFDAFYDEGLEFAAAVDAVKNHGEKETVPACGREFKVGFVNSDNERCNAASRWLRLHALVQRRSSGNVQIYSNKRSDLPSLDNVVRVLRVLELKKKGQKVDREWLDANWASLGRDGNCALVEEWYYFAKGQLILNGSLTTKKPPTSLHTDDIKWAMQVGLDTVLSEDEFKNLIVGHNPR
jgi:hypothetical protein